MSKIATAASITSEKASRLILPKFRDPDETRHAEEIFVERARLHGWKILRSGWPDYLLMKENKGRFEFIAVEVKADRDDEPREGQKLMLAALVMQDVRCFVWNGDDFTLRPIQQAEAAKTLKQYNERLEQQAMLDAMK